LSSSQTSPVLTVVSVPSLYQVSFNLRFGGTMF
jgi:hypothetical protein